MPKHLNLCFKKIRFSLPLASQSHPLSPDDTRRLLDSSATSTASSAIFKNYNSLYDNTFDFDCDCDCSTFKSLTHSSEPEADSEPDFATVFASQRFFFTYPGSSNSIIESTPSPSIAATPESSDTAVLASGSSPIDNANESSYDVRCCDRRCHEHSPLTTVENSVAVPTVSPNPYLDFRRSMQEMVEARDLIDVKANWEYLHELLLCYLALNAKSTHKFIIGAFADLLVSLVAAEGGNDGKIAEITGGKINPGQCR
ncbi:hypothetical protein V6N13_020500 [Hibiscus sabdariffa]|uniref:Transcription repressor n=1 Tax=Hibiscus sabdariffa TaxID=183260 RepID=A0ABR2ETM3_9ROSI